jgi:tetratricopeptide (TPR) repeat protein
MGLSIEALKEQARRHEQEEEWQQALALYLKAIDRLEEDDKLDIGLYNRVGDLQTRLGNIEGAVEHYERAVDLYVEAELPNNAIAVCKKILRNLAGRASVYLKMGQIRAGQGFLSDARQGFLQYAELKMQGGEADEAFRALVEFADLAPEDTEVRLSLAEQLLAHDRPEEAMTQLLAAYHTLAEQGMDQEAADLRARILEMDPSADFTPPEPDPPAWLNEAEAEDEGTARAAASPDEGSGLEGFETTSLAEPAEEAGGDSDPQGERGPGAEGETDPEEDAGVEESDTADASSEDSPFVDEPEEDPTPLPTLDADPPQGSEEEVAEAMEESAGDSEGWDLGLAPAAEEEALGEEEPLVSKPGEGTQAPSDFVDLGALILDDGREKTTRWMVTAEAPSGDEDADFSRMLAQFKDKVAENVDVDDVKAHHDLGTAYKEMGLMNEAVGEFQAALRADPRHLPTIELLGQCFIELGQAEIAIHSLQRGLSTSSAIEDELIGIYYYLARAHEEVGHVEEALDLYEKVFALDINFRDVTERLRALR